MAISIQIIISKKLETKKMTGYARRFSTSKGIQSNINSRRRPANNNFLSQLPSIKTSTPSCLFITFHLSYHHAVQQVINSSSLKKLNQYLRTETFKLLRLKLNKGIKNITGRRRPAEGYLLYQIIISITKVKEDTC